MGFFGRDDRPQPSPQPEDAQPVRPSMPTPLHQPGDRTVIADHILVEGVLTGSGQILVDGRVRGSIEGKDAVVVASRGRVDATVHAREVMVAGRVVGNITADDKIELEPSAQVEGDITAPRILIKEGATFRGRVNMGAPEPDVNTSTAGARKGTVKTHRA